MTRKYDYIKHFTTQDKQGNEYKFTCMWQATSYGFRHVCLNGIHKEYNKQYLLSKACWCNRTWELYPYQTVLYSACDKLKLPEECKKELQRIVL